MRIVYIMSSSFSGSTILDIMLGNGREVLSLGEISKGLRREGSICSCGHDVDTCVLWGNLKHLYLQNNEWSELQRQMNYWDHFYQIPHMLFPTKKSKVYKSQMKALFENLLRLENKEILVDSTKEIGRAFFLLTRFSTVKVIHVVRDVEGILRSNYWRLLNKNQFYFQGKRWSINGNYFLYLFIYTLAWVAENVFAETMKVLYRNKVMTVRYEDLCTQPERELTRIAEFIGVDLGDVIRSVKTQSGLRIGHLIGGNKIRNQRTIVFNPHAGNDKPPVPGRYKYPLRMLTLPVRAYYGYGAGLGHCKSTAEAPPARSSRVRNR